MTHRVGLLLASVALLASCSGDGRRPENVIIVSIDTLNRDALRAFDPDAPELPALDEFSRQALKFVRAHSTASWTLPAHGSLLTGLYPDRHGAVHRETMLAPEVATLAEKLAETGLQTVAFTDGGYLASNYGMTRGFDRYDTRRPSGKAWSGPSIPRRGASNKVRGATLFDRGIAFLEGREPSSDGFFLFLHTYVVHDYFRLHSWALDRLPARANESRKTYSRCLRGERRCAPAAWHRLKALYEAELHRLDEGFAALLAALDEKGLRESTLLIVVSDHGEGFQPERGRIHHGGRLHEDQIRIPFLVAGPGIPPGVSERPVSLVDVMPTVLELMGCDAVPDLDGRSLAEALRGGDRGPARPLLAMEHYYRWHDGRRGTTPLSDRALSMAVVREDDWYVHWEDGEELYDMVRDSEQSHNLSASAGITEPFRELVRAREVFRPTAPAVTLDEALREQLQSLGYID